MKITAAKYVNARKGEASTDSPNPYYIEPGDQVEIKNVTIGSAIEGNSIWYLDTEDNYYWSGGFIESGFDLSFFSPEKALVEKSENFQQSFLKSMLPDFISKYADILFNSIAIGKVNDELRIIISLPPNIKTTVPTEILYKGFLVRIEKQYQEKFFANSTIFQDNSLPLIMGGSMENGPKGAIGCRGLFVELNAIPVILTCYHVGCYNLLTQGKTSFDNSYIPIIIPARKSSSTIGPYTGKVLAGSLGGNFDYSFIGVDNDKFTANISGIGFPNSYYSMLDIDSITVGMKVKVHGCISGYNEGKVTKLSVSTSSVGINYSTLGEIHIYGTIETTKISVVGDSGACVVDENNKVIGIIIASNTDNSLIMPFYKLISIHSLKFLTT